MANWVGVGSLFLVVGLWGCSEVLSLGVWASWLEDLVPGGWRSVFILLVSARSSEPSENSSWLLSSSWIESLRRFELRAVRPDTLLPRASSAVSESCTEPSSSSLRPVSRNWLRLRLILWGD